MKKLLWVPVLISLAFSVSCGKKSGNNSGGTVAAACTQNVTYDQYGRPVQTCANNGVVPNGQNNPYGYYGNNNGYYNNGMNGNVCAQISAQWQTYYEPRMINGQIWCVQPGYRGYQGMY